MRTSFVPFVSSLLVAAACGGGHKPAESVADTSSLETSNASSAPGGATEKAAPAASAPPPNSNAAPAESAAGESAHPVPSAVGNIDGKPFAPKLAHVIAKAQKDGRVLLDIDERTDCPDPADAKAEDAVLTVLVPWEDGYKIDLAALKRTTKKAHGEIGFSRTNAAGKSEPSTTFKPSGRLQVIHAPADKGATGKLKIDLQSGDYMLAGDLDVQVCVAPK